jgi:hypothetical protein
MDGMLPFVKSEERSQAFSCQGLTVDTETRGIAQQIRGGDNEGHILLA